MPRFAATIFLVAIYLPTAWAQEGQFERVMAALESEGRTGDAGVFTNFLDGAGRAYEWSNALLQARKSRPIFCAPETLSLNRSNFATIALDEYRKNKAFYDNDRLLNRSPLDGLALVLRLGLENTFPCKK